MRQRVRGCPQRCLSVRWPLEAVTRQRARTVACASCVSRPSSSSPHCKHAWRRRTRRRTRRRQRRLSRPPQPMRRALRPHAAQSLSRRRRPSLTSAAACLITWSPGCASRVSPISSCWARLSKLCGSSSATRPNAGRVRWRRSDCSRSTTRYRSSAGRASRTLASLRT